jgi:hypothetical protein
MKHTPPIYTQETPQETALLQTANLLIQEVAQTLALPHVSSEPALYSLIDTTHERFQHLNVLLKQCHEQQQSLLMCMEHLATQAQQLHTVLSALQCLMPHPALSTLPSVWSVEQLGISASVWSSHQHTDTHTRSIPHVIQCSTPSEQYPEIPQDLTSATFVPQKAFEQTAQSFKNKDSIIYAMFQAIVLQGGRATTEEIKQYLVRSGVTQTDGRTYEHAPATKITTQVNYLVRRKLVALTGTGVYISRFGWEFPSM